MNNLDFSRLEAKVDRLTDAITQLVRVEERQMNHGARITDLEVRVASCETLVRVADKKVDMWVNRGVGMWGLAVIAWSLYLALRNHVG